MRSDNDTVALFGTVGLVVVYGFGGVFIGLFFLLRRRRLIWKPAAKWGVLIALGSVFLVTINEIPLSWFSYDTSTSAGNFLSSSIINGFLLALGMGAIFALTFMVAEGLGRSAFPGHVQLWKAWGNKTGGMDGGARQGTCLIRISWQVICPGSIPSGYLYRQDFGKNHFAVQFRWQE